MTIDSLDCLSAVTQKKGDLSEDEKAYIKKYGSAWGCDICQLVCPLVKKAIDGGAETPIEFFRENRIKNLTPEALSEMTDEEFKKRGGGMLPAVLEELAEVVSGAEDVERKVEETALISAINDFLSQLSPEKRSMFICRYWRTDSVADIAARCGMTPGAVTMTLSRLRAALRKELLKRGFSI